MTRDEILSVVCACIAEIGMAPDGWESACEGTDIGSLGLSEQDVLSLILCVRQKMEERGCRVNLGVADFGAGATVGQVVDDINLLKSCD